MLLEEGGIGIVDKVEINSLRKVKTMVIEMGSGIYFGNNQQLIRCIPYETDAGDDQYET